MSTDPILPPEPPESEESDAPVDAAAIEVPESNAPDALDRGDELSETNLPEADTPETEAVESPEMEASQTVEEEANESAAEDESEAEDGSETDGEVAEEVTEEVKAQPVTPQEPEIEMVPPGPIRRLLALMLRVIVKVLNWVIFELEAEDIRQQPGATKKSLGDRLTIPEAELEKLTPFRKFWRRLLLTVRSLLPKQLREVSDRNLGLVLSAVVVVGIWVTVGGIGSKPSEMPERAIAQVPPDLPTQPEIAQPEPEATPTAPQLPDVVEITPEIEPPVKLEVEPEIAPDVLADLEAELGVESEEELAELGAEASKGESSAGADSNEQGAAAVPDGNGDRDGDETTVAETNAETKPPVLEMTPEQSLIAAIQDQVVDTAQRYGDSGIVRSIQADFRRGRLLVRIESDQWFGLNPVEQDRMAADLFGRSLDLDFNKLEITTVDGGLLARSPVVGDTMVILQRQGFMS